MSIRQINLLMKAAAGVMLVASAVLLAAAALMPLDKRAASSVDQGIAKTESSSSAPDLPPLEDFAPVFAAHLRGQTIAPAPTVASSGSLTLVGTIGDNVALVRSGNDTEARVVGEKFAGAEIVAVRAGEADIRTSSGLVTLRKAPESSEPSFIREGAQP
jgi:hypothetical protein